MSPIAIAKAKARLRGAHTALEGARNAKSYEDFSDNWYNFLVSTKSVLNMLEQGAKSSPQSLQWFGNVKRTRRSDELLQYLFQARNDAEHGLAEVTKLEPGFLSIGRVAPGYSNHISLSLSTDGKGVPTIHKVESQDGLPVLMEGRAPHVTLVPVSGRGGETYRPPTQHLGSPLTDKLPVPVGEIYLRYLTKLIAEAEELRD